MSRPHHTTGIRSLSIPQGPIQSRQSACSGDCHRDFQFRKVQFRAAVMQVIADVTNFQFRKVQFRGALRSPPNLTPFSFNSARSNSEHIECVAPRSDVLLSIPQGPIQRRSRLLPHTSRGNFQFRKVQFRGLTSWAGSDSTPTFNSARSNSEPGRSAPRRPVGCFQFRKVQFRADSLRAGLQSPRLSIPQGPIQRR